MRFAIGVSYNGFNYHGWQSQEQISTVQQKINQALAKIADHPIGVICAGRTDRGVHALGQVCHFDTHSQRDLRGWLLGSNTHLPADIKINWIKPVDDEFHARFSALSRSYRYIIYNNPLSSAVFSSQLSWHYKPLDEARMEQAAQYLIGEHDFSSYRAAQCQAKSPIRTIQMLRVIRKNSFLLIDIKANAFLHHMVRNITGVLISIGEGKKEPNWANDVLQAKDRKAGDITAPANGLYFMSVEYPGKFNLPQKAESSLSLFE